LRTELRRGVRTDHRADVLRPGPAPYLSDAQLLEAVGILGECVRAAGGGGGVRQAPDSSSFPGFIDVHPKKLTGRLPFHSVPGFLKTKRTDPPDHVRLVN
jgi:hypothetical protein